MGSTVAKFFPEVNRLNVSFRRSVEKKSESLKVTGAAWMIKWQASMSVSANPTWVWTSNDVSTHNHIDGYGFSLAD